MKHIVMAAALAATSALPAFAGDFTSNPDCASPITAMTAGIDACLMAEHNTGQFQVSYLVDHYGTSLALLKELNEGHVPADFSLESTIPPDIALAVLGDVAS